MLSMLGLDTYLYAIFHISLPPSRGIELIDIPFLTSFLRFNQLNPGHMVGMYTIPLSLQYAASTAIVS